MVVFMDAKIWSTYGAERSQPVETGGKWERPENGEIRPKPLPPVATVCRLGGRRFESVRGLNQKQLQIRLLVECLPCAAIRRGRVWGQILGTGCRLKLGACWRTLAAARSGTLATLRRSFARRPRTC